MKINQKISAPEVFLIDAEGKPQGVVNIDQALYLAYESGLDLVEVNSSSRPPVVKIIDYGKYRYAQEKQESKQRSKSKGPEIKEIRLGLKISEHDLDFKIRQAQKFLDNGDKIKVTVKLIGREMKFQEKAHQLIEEFRSKIAGTFEGPTERMGNRFSAILVKK